MNVYEKLVRARVAFQEAGVKKSGQNKFAGYDYFELADILPVINKIAEKLAFCCAVSFSQNEAVLEFIDTEKPEDSILFRSPMSTASLKGCHDVQNLGAVETYIRRYLYLTAFEIVECDALDATTSTATKPQESAEKVNSAKESAKPAEKDNGDAVQEIKRILEESRYPDGEPVFNEADKETYRRSLKERGAKATLASVKATLRGRLGGDA